MNITLNIKYLLLSVILVTPLLANNDASNALRLGDSFYREARFSLALSQYRQYAESSPDRTKLPRVLFRIAEIYGDEEQYNEAIEWYDLLMKEFPSDPLLKNAHFESGEIYETRSQWFDAGEEFYNVWRLFGVSAEAEEALFRSALNYGSGGDVIRSVELYKQYLTRYPSGSWLGETGANAVELLLMRESISEAQELLTDVSARSLSEEWKNEMVFLSAKIAQKIEGDSVAAELLSEVLNGTSEFRSRGLALTFNAELLASEEKYSDAWGNFNEIKSLKDTLFSKDELEFWGDIAFYAGEFTASNELFEELLLVDNVDSSKVLYLIARNYMVADNFSEALKYLKTVVDRGDGVYSKSAQLKIAELYFQNGIYTNAVAEYRNYLSGNGDKSDMVIYRIGRIYQLKLSAPEIALREYEKILKWYTGSPFATKASEAMAELYMSQGKYEEALEMYNYLSSIEGESAAGRTARENAAFLEKFKIPNSVAALSELTSLSLVDTLTEIERRLKGAAIYRNYLNDPNQAIEILYGLIDSTKADPLYGDVSMMIAGSWADLSEQFAYENKSEESDFTRTKAREEYTRIVEDSAYVQLHDEAQYELVALSGDGVTGYEEFVTEFPGSPFRGKAYMVIAHHYSNSDRKDSIMYHNGAVAFRGAYESGDNSIKAEALTGAVQSYLLSGIADTAELFLNSYASAFPNTLRSENYVWLKGQVAESQGKSDSAALSYQYIVEFFPQGRYSSLARLNLAKMQLLNDQPADAFNNFVVVTSLFPDGDEKGDAQNGSVEALILLGRTEDALAKLSEIGTPEWFSVEQRSQQAYLTGRALQLSGESYLALQSYGEVLADSSFSEYVKVLHEAAALSFSVREYLSSAMMYEQLRGSGDDSVYYELQFLKATILAGNGTAVADQYKKFKRGAGDENPEMMGELYFAEGLYFYRQEEFGKAESRFEYIVNSLPRVSFVSDAAYYLALMQYDQRKYDEALESFQEFISQYAESELIPTVHFTMAMIYFQREMFAEAATEYQTVAETAGDDIELRFRALVNGASVWQKLSAWEAAAAMNEAVLNEYADRIDISTFSLKTGFSYFKANRVHRALNYFEQAMENASTTDEPEIVYWKALCNKRLGNNDLALEQFLQISVLFRDSGKWRVTADFEAARIYEQRGGFSKALSLYREIVRIEGENSPIGGDANERVMVLETLMEEN